MPTFQRLRNNQIRGSTGAPSKKTRGKTFLQRNNAFKKSVGVHNFVITDTIVDSAGNPIPNATVKLFRSGNDSFVDKTVSNGSGVYTFTLSNNAGNFYIVAYLVGAPDIFGTSSNTLVLV